MDSGIFSYKLNVNYFDVNQDNKITNRGILRLMQEVAGMHSNSLGYGVNNISETGLAWIILNWRLKVFDRPKTETPLTIQTWLRSKNPLFTFRDFSIYDKEKRLIATASSRWVLYDINKKNVIKIPEEVNKVFSYIEKFAFEEELCEKIREPKDSKFVMNYLVGRRDIDTNHHVNNLYYLDYAYEALPEDVYKLGEFSDIEIMYKHEAKLGDKISLWYYAENNEFLVTIKDEEEKRIHAIIKLKR